MNSGTITSITRISVADRFRLASPVDDTNSMPSRSITTVDFSIHE
jgi:hypothetical protein